jgi:hypothetical protein
MWTPVCRSPKVSTGTGLKSASAPVSACVPTPARQLTRAQSKSSRSAGTTARVTFSRRTTLAVTYPRPGLCCLFLQPPQMLNFISVQLCNCVLHWVSDRDLTKVLLNPWTIQLPARVNASDHEHKNDYICDISLPVSDLQLFIKSSVSV